MVRAALVIIACLAAIDPAHAQPQNRQKAAEHFKRAEAAEKAGRHQEAIDEYLAAYSLIPHADVLFNIALNFEALQQWAPAAEYYQRYLDERTDPPADADAVRAKIREIRTRIPPAPGSGNTGDPRPPRPPQGDPPAPPFGISDQPPPPPSTPLSRWHGGGSYGFGFGDAPVERYLLHAGMRFAHRLDVDAIVGVFGKNDHAIGLMGRLLLGPRGANAQPFARGAVTIGYAKQDASSSAGTRFPVGAEAGAGVQLGAKGRVELVAALRFTAGGWGADETTADSYVNDAFAFAVDLGVVLDFGIISGVR
jgi:hypothetical protein